MRDEEPDARRPAGQPRHVDATVRPKKDQLDIARSEVQIAVSDAFR